MALGKLKEHQVLEITMASKNVLSNQHRPLSILCKDFRITGNPKIKANDVYKS